MSSEVKPFHFDQVLNIIAGLIKEKTIAINWKKKNDEKFAKVNSDLSLSRKKVGRL